MRKAKLERQSREGTILRHSTRTRCTSSEATEGLATRLKLSTTSTFSIARHSNGRSLSHQALPQIRVEAILLPSWAITTSLWFLEAGARERNFPTSSSTISRKISGRTLKYPTKLQSGITQEWWSLLFPPISTSFSEAQSETSKKEATELAQDSLTKPSCSTLIPKSGILSYLNTLKAKNHWSRRPGRVRSWFSTRMIQESSSSAGGRTRGSRICTNWMYRLLLAHRMQFIIWNPNWVLSLAKRKF